MADALAMEASKGLITEAANGIITAVISRVAEEVKHAWNFERDLKTLEIKLKRIHLLLCGALNSASSNPILDDWLNKVKNVAYDADDLLDVFAFESLKRRVKIESRSVKMSEKLIRYLVDNPIVFRFWMGRRVRELMGAIDGIFGDARELGIKPVEITASNSSASRSVCIADKELDVQREVVSGGSLIGRDDDEAHIVNMLCDPANMKRDLSIFAIVGMAGMFLLFLCGLLLSLLYCPSSVIELILQI
uniref:Disease resistance N-terminal domain-containing protein n=1 Tax=Opuntia streptacantha TaxID=393608 RepID=A0A7C9AIT1_OPUST